MKTEFRVFNLEGFFRDFLFSGDNPKEFKIRFEKYLNNLEDLDKIIENKQELDNDKFINILDFFSTIYIDYLDLLNILRDMNGFKYNQAGIIKTKMINNVRKTEGHGRDFSWWYEKVGIDYQILYDEKSNLNLNNYYSKEEIKKLVETKQIILINELERKINDNCITNEEYCKFDTLFSNSFNLFDSHSITEIIDINNPALKLATYRYIRKNMSKGNILEGMKHCLGYFYDDINQINNNMCLLDKSYSKTLETMKKVLEDEQNTNRLNTLKQKYLKKN